MRADVTEKFGYTEIIDWQEWMGDSVLTVKEVEAGCGACGNNAVSEPVLYDVASLASCDGLFEPDFLYVRPPVEKFKVRHVKGTAYIDFRLGDAGVLPDYRDNSFELGKITDVLASVRDDRDTEIKSLVMTGYASPDGPFARNENLAGRRVESLRQYLSDLFPFILDHVSCMSVAEDWDGLYAHVRDSGLEDREGILEIIAGDENPDVRENRIRKEYPVQFQYMRTRFYPLLRRTEYSVEYSVRSYGDVSEIAAMMETAPQKLSLHELFLLAASLDTESDEFKEVFEVAVRMFPDDPAANLNAANTAMGRKDFRNAARYLEKAGDSPEAVYAKGIHAALTGSYDAAVELFREAADSGIDKAAAALEQLGGMKIGQYNI